MKKIWNKFSYPYKILLSMFLLILTIQLGTLLYIWTHKSEILLEKERESLEYQLHQNEQRLMLKLDALEKELNFLAILEVMDDVVVNDIDQRIQTLLHKKAKDLGQGIVLLLRNNKGIVSSSKKYYNEFSYLKFTAPIFASFEKKKLLGSLVLLYPYENFQQLKMDNPHQKLWLSSSLFQDKTHVQEAEEAIVVSKKLNARLKDWVLFLSHEKKDALQSIHEIERILLWGFLLSMVALLFVVWILSKKQMKILEDTQDVLALKRTFLSTMSHELRTPLGSILTLTQHLLMSANLKDNDAAMLNKIESASEHLLSMINNLLQLSKLESKSMQVQQEKVDIVFLIEEMIAMLEPLIDEKDLLLNKNLLQGQHLIHTDPNLFKQVVMNLLSNAIKFTQKGSISITLSKNNLSYTLSIKDTGIGIDKEKQSSIFSEFYQAHTGKEEIKHSTGLGLALSQKVAKLINGEISIESKGLGKGTEVRFWFASFTV